jgi:hypothetical protein
VYGFKKISYFRRLNGTIVVTFNWISEGTPDPGQSKYYIELEYQLRSRITRFLLKYLEPEYQGDFSDFHFDVDLIRREVRISDKTPPHYLPAISSDFMKEIGWNCC